MPVHRNITNLYKGKYPYKVETIYPATNYKEIKSGTTNSTRRKMVISSFKRTCMRFVPDNTTDWSYSETLNAFHFYFMNQKDMEWFAVNIGNKAAKIYSPANQNDIDILSSTKNVMIRETLFHNLHRYCINFKSLNPLKKAELDTWVKEVFGDNSERSSYNSFGVRKLYVNNEGDILMARIAFSVYVTRIQQIILRSEIP